MTTKVVVLGALLGVVVLSAGSAQAQMQPIAAAQEVMRFAGEWTGTGSFTDETGTAELALSVTCSSAAGGAGVMCSTRFVGPEGVPTMEEAVLFGGDNGDGLLHFFSITSDGSGHDHKGSFNGVDAFTFEYVGPMGGQVFIERIQFSFSAENALHFESVGSLGSTQIFAFTGDMTK